MKEATRNTPAPGGGGGGTGPASVKPNGTTPTSGGVGVANTSASASPIAGRNKPTSAGPNTVDYGGPGPTDNQAAHVAEMLANQNEIQNSNILKSTTGPGIHQRTAALAASSGLQQVRTLLQTLTLCQKSLELLITMVRFSAKLEYYLLNICKL